MDLPMKQNHTNPGLTVIIPADNVKLNGILTVPDNASGLILFAHGSGSSRLSPRNLYVAEVLNKAGFATLLFDLLTAPEEKIDAQTAKLRFDIEFLSMRLIEATNWSQSQPAINRLSIGYFGASTGGGAAIMAAAQLPEIIKAVVSRGGRPDLAGSSLPLIKAATLLIVVEMICLSSP